MKRILLLLCLFCLCFIAKAQFFVAIESTDGIQYTITPNSQIKDQYYVVLQNTHRFIGEEWTSSKFEWCLTYCGKCISDYYREEIPCKKNNYDVQYVNRTVYCWPNTVPAGHEKYVTVHLGRIREPIIKDHRDDD